MAILRTLNRQTLSSSRELERIPRILGVPALAGPSYAKPLTLNKTEKRTHKMKAKQWFGIARIVIKALKVALSELAEARAPDSPAGAKITRDEAEEVAAAALSSILDDIAGILTNA
jgi:hypothetical protein